MNYGGRLTKGETWIMGRSDKSTYYMTKYTDGAVEIWVRHKTRAGYLEETVVGLLKYEVECLKVSDANRPDIPVPALPAEETES